MPKPSPPPGFTLTELVIVLAIVSIIAMLVLPSLSDFIQHQQRHAASADLVRLLNTARSTAIAERTSVTLCPLDATGSCTGNWSDELTAFRDPMRNRAVSNPSQIIRVLPEATPGERIGSTGLFNYLAFRANGQANTHIGNIVWCPPDRDARKATQVVVSWGGRIRVARDHDGDGLVEQADGSPVSCP